MKLRKRFIRRILMKIIFEFQETAKNAAFIIKHG